jgi:hypothetical protein
MWHTALAFVFIHCSWKGMNEHVTVRSEMKHIVRQTRPAHQVCALRKERTKPPRLES